MRTREALKTALMLLFLACFVGIPVSIGLGSVPAIVAAGAGMVISLGGFFLISGRETSRDKAALAAEGDFLERYGFNDSGLFNTDGVLAAPLPLFEKGRKAADGGWTSSGSHGIGTVRVGELGGQRVALADYSITTQTHNPRTGTTTHTERFAAAIVEVPADLPPFSVEREGLLTRAADTLGLKDIELGHAEFDKRFQVGAREPELVRELLDAELMQRLLAMPDTVQLAGGGGFIVAWRPGTVDSGPRQPLVEAATTAASRVPRSVLERHAAAASPRAAEEPW